MKKRKRNKKQATVPNGGIIYTVQGEWFPEEHPALLVKYRKEGGSKQDLY